MEDISQSVESKPSVIKRLVQKLTATGTRKVVVAVAAALLTAIGVAVEPEVLDNIAIVAGILVGL